MQAKTLIRSAAVTSLMDFVQMLLYGASFWLTFCPATILSSQLILERLRLAPQDEEPVESDIDASNMSDPQIEIQQETQEVSSGSDSARTRIATSDLAIPKSKWTVVKSRI